MTKYELRITGECKQNLKLCKKRGLPTARLCRLARPRTVTNRALAEKFL